MEKLKKSLNRRKHKRFDHIDGSIPGILINYSDSSTVHAHAIDVSKEGLAIITEKPLTPNQVLVLTSSDQKYELIVANSNPVDFQKQNKFRSGLKLKDNSKNLLEVFQKENCFIETKTDKHVEFIFEMKKPAK